MLLGLEGGDSEGASAGVVVGEGELGGRTQWMPWWYLYLLPINSGGAALLGLLGGVNNYERCARLAFAGT